MPRIRALFLPILLGLMILSLSVLFFNFQIIEARQEYVYARSWGSAGSNSGQFQDPSGLALDSSGNVYIADTGNSRVEKFDKNGNFIAAWGVFCNIADPASCTVTPAGSKIPSFNSPVAVAVDYFGDIYVADPANHRIVELDSTGKEVRHWGSQGSGDGQFGIGGPK